MASRMQGFTKESFLEHLGDACVCVCVCVSMSDSDPGMIKDEIRLCIMGDYEIPDLGLSED